MNEQAIHWKGPGLTRVAVCDSTVTDTLLALPL